MKASELRIGNFVNFKDREDIDYCEVTALDTGGYIHILRNFKDGEEDDQPEALEDITPIVLTEKWLKRLGFIKTSDEFNYEKEYEIMGLYLRESKAKGIFEYRDTEVKYVHELQNLYHALTKEELKLRISE